jgi:hypothetical protein
MHSIEWTDFAINSYNNLIARTKSFETALDETLATIELMPHALPFDEDYQLSRAVINKRHILFYTVKLHHQVDLILFFDTKASPSKLKELL